MSDAPNANDELYPIAVLIDELKVRPPAMTAGPLVAPSRQCNPRYIPLTDTPSMTMSSYV